VTAVFQLSAIEAALASLFPPGVAVAAERIGAAPTEALWPEERDAILGAVAPRLAEFAAGRVAARRCLAALGRAPMALPMGRDRSAVWPTGVYGAISHAAGIAVAVAGESGPLGIDIEEDVPLEADLWPVICSAEELSWMPADGRGGCVRRVFAAKEAVFKAQDPARRAMFGFEAFAVRIVETGFVARVQRPVGAFVVGEEITGRLAVTRGLVLAGVAR
jgi:4'-phosphopantetheinyl transferase EntD